MASNSLESPGKKRKPTVDHLKRDQPLFATRRPAPALQQPPDFLTDSVNTSYIPSPSPPKSPTRQGIRAKPRQALDRKSLTAAFKATAESKDESKPPHFPPPLERSRPEQLRKPRATQTSVRTTPQPTGKPARSLTPTRTPTPPRGRDHSVLQSPVNSESSPGRGYAEAYQRIVEEENLAQEDSVEDMELEGFDYSQDDLSQDLDRLRQQRIRNSVSPTSLKASRRASPTGIGPLDDYAIGEKENIAHDSGSDLGEADKENVTTTSADSGSSQYARDIQRLNGLKSGGKAFSKARLGQRVGLTVENLRRRNGSNESLGSAYSAGTLSNRGSDPSVNVPKAWGRKAKPGKDWLSRINSRSGKLTGDVSKRHSSGEQMIAENEQKDRGESIDEWVEAAAEVPLPTQEGSSQTTPSQGSTPTTAVQGSGSPEKRRDWEMNDDEFTGRSLQVSESPPIRIKNNALDLLRDREIESLEKRGVTTSRLDELRQKKSQDRLRRSPSGSSERLLDLDADDHRRASRRSSQKSSLRESALDTPHATAEDEGQPVPDTPIVICRTKSNNLVGLQEPDASGIQNDKKSPLRNGLEREDSQDLLKRLARATSESPSPTKEQLEADRPKPAPGTKAEVEQTPKVSKPASNRKTPFVTGAWADQSYKETPAPSMPNDILKTPFVTGAWIDTPLPIGGRGPPMPTPAADDQKDFHTEKPNAANLILKLSPKTQANVTRPRLSPEEPLKYTGPALPKSALENIINAAKSSHPPQPSNSDSEDDPTLHLGDSTIQSLEDLIVNDTDLSTILPPTPPSEQTSPPTSDPSPQSLIKPSKAARLADIQSYTHILSRLTSLAPSLRDSKKQLASLERCVSSPTPSALTTAECDEGGEFHDFIWPCQRCGCPGRIAPEYVGSVSFRDNITSIRVPVPRLWIWREGDWRPRLTWLGVVILMAGTLLWAENWAMYIPPQPPLPLFF